MPAFALAEPESPFAAALPSTLLHAALLTGALWATRATAVVISDDPISVDILLPLPATPHTPATITMPLLPGAPILGAPVISDLPSIAPIPSLPAMNLDPRNFLPGTDPTPGSIFSGDPRPGAQILSETEVDDVPSLLSAGPLRYPPVLREAGITGRVTLQFVIDTDGRVEEQGIEVLAATHAGFVAAATETIKASRFHPAKSHGSTVRVRVRQTIVFRD